MREAFQDFFNFIFQFIIFAFEVFIHKICVVFVFAKNDANLANLLIVGRAIVFEGLMMSFAQIHALNIQN